MSSNPEHPVAKLRHDLRTPVNQILGYSEMLMEEAEAEGNTAMAGDLVKIQAAARTLVSLIDTRIHDEGILPPGDRALNVMMPSVPAKTGAVSTSPPLSGSVLIVDDDAGNRDMLAKRLSREGLKVETVSDGFAALAALSRKSFDVVLLDVMMPEIDGYEILCQAKQNPATRDVPVIMISALDELESVIRCIEAGAEDYLPKPFNPTLLRARLSASLEKKRLRDAEQKYLQDIEVVQKRLQSELGEAARYVRSIIPEPQQKAPRTDWKYVPSTELGGDAFGYHWVDSEHFAIYLLDVCGHGVGSALLSVAAMNVLRSGSLPNTDFRDPAAVLSALNAAFPMERQNNLYFTIWYGVYHAPTRLLRYSSGGHPPALLIQPAKEGSAVSKRLQTPGLIIGVMQESKYTTGEETIPPGATLAVFCDGCYEVSDVSGEIMAFEDFEAFMGLNAARGDGLERLQEWVIERHGKGSLDDDFSILRVHFDVMADHLQVVIGSTLEEIPPANERIAQWLGSIGASVEAIHFATLCVEEIVSNCIKYGCADSQLHKIEVHIKSGDSKVQVEFCDEGREFNPLTVPEPDVSAPIEERSIGGLGLQMIRKTVDGAEYRRDGMVNRLVLWKLIA